MRRVRYLAGARQDLTEIYLYIDERSGSSRTAERFVQRLRRQCRHLAGLSTILGRPRPELRPGLRGYVFENYLILMRYEEKTLDIVNVIESHRDVEALFRKSE